MQTDGREADQVVADSVAVPATNTGSKGYWAGKSEAEILFSQQFQMQQRIEDLCEEMNNIVHCSKALPSKYEHKCEKDCCSTHCPFISCTEANQWTFDNWFVWFCECVSNNNRGCNDNGGGNDSENEAWYKDWE